MAENTYQAGLIKRLYKKFPGSVIIKNDPRYRQGMLDLTIFWKDKWAMLEVKASRGAKMQPNQPYYVKLFNKMSFAAVIYPENEKEILTALQKAFSS